MRIEEIIDNVSIHGIERAIRVSKYPMSVNVNDCTIDLTERQGKLASADAGTGHNNFLSGIIVLFDLTFTNKAWVEMERYHFFQINSCQSTMHRIAKLDFDKSMIDYVTENAKNEMLRLRSEYERADGDEKKEAYLRLLYNCPSGLRLTAGCSTNYLQLKTIYHQRRTHRLPEWQVFCDWIETLPMSEWIIGCEKKA